MKKRNLIIGWLVLTSLLLAWCWDKPNPNTNKTQEKTSNVNQQKKESVKKSIDNRLKKQALSMWLNADKLNVKKFKEAYDVWAKCQRRFCKRAYDNIKQDRITLKYFNVIVWKYHIPKNAIKYSSPEDVINAETKNGYTSLSSCYLGYKKQYKSIKECIKENYRKFKNLSKDKENKIKDFLKNWYNYNIGFNDYITIKRTCQWWKNKWFEIWNKLANNLKKQKEQWFNSTNFFKETYMAYLKNKMTPQQYFTMMKKLCWYNEFIKQQKNKPQPKTVNNK